MLRKVECDNIFVLANSEDITNTESHIIRSITESGASHINKSPLTPTMGRSGKFQKQRTKERDYFSSGATNLVA